MAIPFGATTFAEIYERELVQPLFEPWARDILDDIELRPDQRLLDIACGTGIVARLAHARLQGTGKVVGVDQSAPMLRVAREVAPEIDWRDGSAAALPLSEDESFDVVTCQQGLQFFPDREASVGQMYGALDPGGRVAISTWRDDREMPLLHALRRVVEEHVGPILDRRHCYGDADELQTLLRQAGFTDVACRVVTRTIHFEDAAVFVRLNAAALVGMSAASRDRTDDERQALIEAVTREGMTVVAPHTDGAALDFEIGSNVALGRR